MLVFLRKNTRIHKNGRNSYELFVLALSSVWFAGATPDNISLHLTSRNLIPDRLNKRSGKSKPSFF